MLDVHWIDLSGGKDASYITPKCVESPARIHISVGSSDNLEKPFYKARQAV